MSLRIKFMRITLHPETHLIVLLTISHRWQIQLPLIVSNSIRILSDGGLGMAMFSLGMYYNSKPLSITCG
jgi:auxin efflux carrier family protein